jgi:hypothetical protein
MDRSILNNCEIRRLSNAVADGTSAVEPAAIDMQGWGGICVIAALGTVTAGGQVLTLKQSDDSGGTPDDFDAIVATAANAAADDNKLLIAEVYHPTKRYIQVSLGRTGSTVVDGIIAVLFRPHVVPVTQGSTVAQIATAASPDEV